MTTNRAFLMTLFVLLFSALVSLGLWQLRRADEREASQDRFALGRDLPALTAPLSNQGIEEYRYRRLELRGRYLSSRQVLLDSMIHEGRAGYHVLTPFLPLNDSRWVLVNRGWVEADPDRRVLPGVEVGETIRVVTGQLDALPRPGLELGGSIGPEGWPLVALFPSPEELEERFGEPLMGYQLLLDAEMPDGYVRQWQLRMLSPERHVGYAIQWFSLAGTLLVIAVILSLRSRKFSAEG